MRHLWLPRIAYSRDGNGTFSLPEAAFVSGTSISATAVNSNFSNIGAALTQSVSKDGQTAFTGNQPMGGFKFTGLGAGSNSQDSVRVDQVVGSVLDYAADTGTATAYAMAPSPGISSYAVGQRFSFKASNANSDADPTLAVNSLTAGIIYWPDGTSLVEGDIPANAIVHVSVASVAAGTPTFHLQTGHRGDPTGTTKGFRGKSTQIPKGWMIESGGTIGDASSGATRAKADCKALFKLLWENSNYTLQDSAGSATTKGADSDTDWAAHKRLILTSFEGRFRAGNNSAGGDTGGTATHTHTVSGSGSGSATGTISGTTGQSGDFRGKTDGGTASSNNTHTHNFSASANLSVSVTTSGTAASASSYPPYVTEISIIKL